MGEEGLLDWKTKSEDPNAVFSDYLASLDEMAPTAKDVISSFPVYVGYVSLARYLAFYELYKQVMDLPGHIAEIGTYRGASFLTDLTGQARFTVAYPYGFHDENTHRAMRELDLRAGLTMERRAIGPQDLSDRWSIPRYDVNDCFDRESNQMQEAVFSQIEASPSETTG